MAWSLCWDMALLCTMNFVTHSVFQKGMAWKVVSKWYLRYSCLVERNKSKALALMQYCIGVHSACHRAISSWYMGITTIKSKLLTSPSAHTNSLNPPQKMTLAAMQRTSSKHSQFQEEHDSKFIKHPLRFLLVVSWTAAAFPPSTKPHAGTRRGWPEAGIVKSLCPSRSAST